MNISPYQATYAFLFTPCILAICIHVWYTVNLPKTKYSADTTRSLKVAPLMNRRNIKFWVAATEKAVFWQNRFINSASSLRPSRIYQNLHLVNFNEIIACYHQNDVNYNLYVISKIKTQPFGQIISNDNSW